MLYILVILENILKLKGGKFSENQCEETAGCLRCGPHMS